MFGILDRYVGKNIIFSVLLVSICLTLFTFLIGLIDSLRYIGRGSVDFLFVVEYNLYKVPGSFVTFFPVSILIGGVIGLGNLAKNSEIIVLQSIGLSKLNIGVSCIKSLIPLILIVMCVSEFATARCEKYAEERYDIKVYGMGVSFTSSGTWFKERDTFIGIRSIYNNAQIMNIIRYDFDGITLRKISRADRGAFIDGKWIMQNVIEHEINDENIATHYFKTKEWKLNVNVERLEVLGEISSNMPIWQLVDYIKYIEQNGVDSSRYRLFFYNKILSPVVMLVMLLLSLSTIFGPLRSMNMSTRIVAGIALGFGYYVLNQIVSPFSIVYGVPPIIGASFASIVFASLALYLLKRKS